MNNKLYLHVGMDKTGTSAIQRFVYNNRGKLNKEAGIYYPKTGIWSDFSHHPFAFSICNIGGYDKGNLSKLLHKLSKEIKNKETVLISSECLFKAPLKNNISIFKDFLDAMCTEVKVVGYVRRQDEWVESRHKHSILSGQELSLEQLQRPFFCNYKQFFDGWAEIVGKKNVMVRPYEKRQFVGGSILSDFLSVFGVNNFSAYCMKNERVNHSLGIKETEFKRHCNCLKLPRGGASELNDILLNHSAMSKNFGNNKYFLSPTQRKGLIDRYKKDNCDLAIEYGQKNEMFLDQHPDTSHLWVEDKTTEEQKMSDIYGFIYREKKRFFHVLGQAINEARHSTDEKIKYSAEILESARQNCLAEQ